MTELEDTIVMIIGHRVFTIPVLLQLPLHVLLLYAGQWWLVCLKIFLIIDTFLSVLRLMDLNSAQLPP